MASKWRDIIRGAGQSRADFLVDGEEYFRSVVSAVETATTQNDFVYILGWMVDVDFQLAAGSKRLYKLLVDAARLDVEIRILIWDNPIPAYYGSNREFIKILDKYHNTNIFLDNHTFFPQKSKDALLLIAMYARVLIDHALTSLVIEKLETSHEIPVGYVLDSIRNLSTNPTIGAHHEKVIIVRGNDGRLVAFCGGMDLNSNRIRPDRKSETPRFPYYHDTACRVEGPAAYEILSRFIRRWKNHPLAKNVLLQLGENELGKKAASYPQSSRYVKVVGTYNSVNGYDRERTLRDYYLKIIENAKNYIYIEDQYLVNMDVARALNAKIKETDFKKLFIVIQDSKETSDILIPNAKRDDFMKEVLREPLTPSEKEKVLLAMIDRTDYYKRRFHPALHSKTLIVDDEIAIIGSANVNQRSFTCDSETSVVVFDDDPENPDENFARSFRIKIWKDFEVIPNINPAYYDSWYDFPTDILNGSNRSSILIKYSPHVQEDLDIRIKRSLTTSRKAAIFDALLYQSTGNPTLIVAKNASLTKTVDVIFRVLWENFIDPKVD